MTQKRALLTVLIASIFSFYASPLHAIDFKAKGQWAVNFDYGQHGTLSKGHVNGYNGKSDEFDATQRVRLQIEAIASESLSGVVQFEIGKQTWGSASNGGALGADGTFVKVKHAYLDWMFPTTKLKMRMGIQAVVLPSFTSDTQVFGADVAAVTMSYPINDTASITAFWARPFNDNYAGDTRRGQHDANFMDNMDMFGVVVPLRFEGVRVSPWAMYSTIGSNIFRKDSDYYGNFKASNYYTRYSLLPLGGPAHRKNLSTYGNAWWAGVTGEINAYDPFRLSWDFNYGSFTMGDDGSSRRAGWLGSVLLEYKTAWGIPGLYGWYGSGDDADMGNGSERMPSTNIDEASSNASFSHFAFKGGRPNSTRDAVITHSMTGTWGVGARVKNVSFIDNIKHELLLHYIGGTNDPGILKNYHTQTGKWLAPNEEAIGKGNLYLTRNDSAMELNLRNEVKLYDNLSLFMDFAYLALWLDKSDSVWGRSRLNGRDDSVHDAWNVEATFVYSF